MLGRRRRAREREIGREEAYADDRAAGPRGGRRRAVGRGAALGAAAAGTVGAGFLALARLVMLATLLVVALIVVAIVLFDVGANGGNSIVKAVHDGANFFSKPFNNVFVEHGHAKKAISLNWGLAAVVYFLVGSLIASFIRRIGSGGMLAARRRTAAV